MSRACKAEGDVAAGTAERDALLLDYQLIES